MWRERVELGRVRVLGPEGRPRQFNDHALHAHTEPERRHLALAAETNCLHLALDTPVAEAARYDDAVEADEWLDVAVALELLAVDPDQLHVAAGRPRRMLHGLGDRQIRVRQLDVLTDQADRQRDTRAADAVDQEAPLAEIRLGRALPKPELLDDDAPETGLFEHQRYRVDGPGVGLGDDVVDLHVTEQRDLFTQVFVDRLVRARDEHVRLDTDGAQLLDGVLRRLRLQLAGRDTRQQREVDVQDVLAADVIAELADRFEVRERLDVADGATDLHDDELRLLLARDAVDALLDLVRHVWDDLHGGAEVVAPAFLRDHGVVDLAGREIRRTRDVAVDEALVVAEVEIALGPVLRDEHLAVLIRRHRSRVDVEVRIHLQRRDGETARGKD